MGMYTGIRFIGVVKPEFRPLIEELHTDSEWGDLAALYPEYDFIAEYADDDRADFIPFGSLSYMPVEWDESAGKYDEETGVWAFTCSLKNHDNTIQKFFNLIIPNMIEEVHYLEYYYEEWVCSKFYKLIGGKVVEDKREGNKYGFYPHEEYSTPWFLEEE